MFADVVYWLVVRAARLSTTVPIVRIFAMLFSVCVCLRMLLTGWSSGLHVCQQQCQLFVSLPCFSLCLCLLTLFTGLVVRAACLSTTATSPCRGRCTPSLRAAAGCWRRACSSSCTARAPPSPLPRPPARTVPFPTSPWSRGRHFS